LRRCRRSPFEKDRSLQRTTCGPGVQGFSEAGQTRVFSGEFATDVHRVVLVAADPDQMRFQVAVDDVLAPALTAVVVEAVDDNNAAIVDLTEIEVTLNR
jgi:hypothetical protein